MCTLFVLEFVVVSLKPSRIGQLSPSSGNSPGPAPTGLVFLLNTTAVYIRDFQSNVGKKF